MRNRRREHAGTRGVEPAVGLETTGPGDIAGLCRRSHRPERYVAVSKRVRPGTGGTGPRSFRQAGSDALQRRPCRTPDKCGPELRTRTLGQLSAADSKGGVEMTRRDSLLLLSGAAMGPALTRKSSATPLNPAAPDRFYIGAS